MKRIIKFFRFIALAIIFCLFGCAEQEYEIKRNIAGRTETGNAVMVMDPDMISSKLKEITSDGVLIFHNLSAKDKPKIGDIICSAPSLAAPHGFLYRVKEVKISGYETTVVTEFAAIEEAVEEADLDEILELTIADIEEEEGVEIVNLLQDSNLQLRAISIGAGVKLDIDKKIDNNLHIKGFVELKSTARCEIKIGFFKLDRFLFSLQPQFKAQLAATYEGKIEKNITFPITSINCSPVTFWAGIVPVVFVPKISIVGVLTTKGEVKIQATLVDWDYSYTFGILYQNGKWNTINENTSKPAKYLEDVQLVLTGEMKLQPKLSYKFDLYNTGNYAGLVGDFYAKLKVIDNVGSDIKLTFSCGLEFGAEAELKILSFKLATLRTTFLSLEWLIWEKFWGTGEETNYILDNGYVAHGWRGLPSNTESIWMGNKFSVGESGVLTSIDVYSFFGSTGGGYDYVTIEVFNSSWTRVGSSSQFVLPDTEWRNVVLNNIPYSGTFYVMVRWPAYSNTNFVGMDLYGPNANKRLAYFMSDYWGWQVMEDMEEYESDRWYKSRGVFLLRANAIVAGKSIRYGNEGENVDDLPRVNSPNLFEKMNKPNVESESAPYIDNETKIN